MEPQVSRAEAVGRVHLGRGEGEGEEETRTSLTLMISVKAMMNDDLTIIILKPTSAAVQKKIIWIAIDLDQ